MNIPELDELLEKAQQHRTVEEAEAMLYEDAFYQWLREHANGHDIHEFFTHLEASSFHTANSIDELFAMLGWQCHESADSVAAHHELTSNHPDSL